MRTYEVTARIDGMVKLLVTADDEAEAEAILDEFMGEDFDPTMPTERPGEYVVDGFAWRYGNADIEELESDDEPEYIPLSENPVIQAERERGEA